MHTEAMIQLKNVLLKVREQHNTNEIFDMKFWICDTSACAAGWAGLDPWFRKRNFITDKESGEVCYRKYEGLEATEKLFKLTEPVCGWLFFGVNYDTNSVTGKPMVDRVIKRINWLLTDYDPNKSLETQLNNLSIKMERKLSI